MLTSINFEPVYDSSQCNIIHDLILPALTHGVEYWRGVGFFTSGWLRLTASGIGSIAEKGGRIRFVVSPMMDSEDIRAIRLAADAELNESIRRNLRKNIDEIAENLESNTLNTFAWLLADGIIEFKFAIPKLGTEGDYHDKVGVCIDEGGNKIAFHGSFNDTYKGTLNGEAFSVFKSWNPEQNIYTEAHFARLKALWEHGNSQFSVYPFDEALRQHFINLRQGDRPYAEPAGKLNIKELQIDYDSLLPKPHNPHEMRKYQDEAILLWQGNHSRGILEMATGTGKTITALAAAIKTYEQSGNLFLVILVPYAHLLSQWQDNVKEFGLTPLLCSSDFPSWRQELMPLVQSFTIKTTLFPCVIALMQTACSLDFCKAIATIPTNNFMLIADETHYLGARDYQKALFPNARFRLGLSATPNRWMDPVGTKCLMAYYEKTVYTFTLDRAIKEHYLTPYCYHPLFVELTPDETDDYTAKTSAITKLQFAIKSDPTNKEIEEKIKQLLILRAQIIDRADQKTDTYCQLLDELQSSGTGDRLNHLLVFCAPGTHKGIVKLTNSKGLRTHEFVAETENELRGSILSSFAVGELDAIVSIRCMDEGVDVPSTTIAILLASTTNPKEFIQRRGRILRTYKGKDFAHIYDLVAIPSKSASIEIARSVVRHELPRFYEFARSAQNKYDAISHMRPILEELGLKCYIDMEPWTVYHESTTPNRDDVC